MLVTKVGRSALSFHRPSQLESVHLDALRKILLQHTNQELAIVTEIEKRKSSRDEALKKWKLGRDSRRKIASNSEGSSDTMGS